MVHLFLLVSVLLHHTRLTNSRDLRCALSIQLENHSVLIKLRPGSDRGAIRERSGREYGECSAVVRDCEK